MRICTILECEKGSWRILERCNRPNPMKFGCFRLQIWIIWFAVLMLSPGQIGESIHTKLIEGLGPWTLKARRKKINSEHPQQTLKRPWDSPWKSIWNDEIGKEHELGGGRRKINIHCGKWPHSSNYKWTYNPLNRKDFTASSEKHFEKTGKSL